MKNFRIKLLALLLTASMILSGCSATDSSGSTTNDNAQIGDSSTKLSLEYQEDDSEDEDVDIADSVEVSLNGDSISCDSSNVSIDGSTMTITSSGSYSISGTLNDGQIVVDCADTDKVYLILNGVDISNSTTAPIYVLNADKTIITLAEGTDNTITDNRSAKSDDTDDSGVPGSAIYSKDDLTINGEGNLIVTGNYNNGIVCKNDLKISGGNLTVTALNNAIKGNDTVTIKNNASINISCDGDGIRTDYIVEDESTDTKGYIYIESGNITIQSIGDCLKADTYLTIDGGTFDLTSNGGYTNGTSTSSSGDMSMGSMHGNSGGKVFNSDDMGDMTMADGEEFNRGNMGDMTMADGEEFNRGDMGDMAMPDGGEFNFDDQGGTTTTTTEDTLNSKTISADGDLTINDGTFTLNSSDDSIHTNANLVINGGTFTINSGAKGIHSDYDCTINGGTIEIQNSYEGIEGTNIYVNDGNLSITSSDDGFNASDHTETATGSNGFNASSNAYLEFNGGYTYVNAGGDGLDSNGDMKFTGGTVIVEGPTSSADGPLDCGDNQNVITVDGGTLIAGGAVGMFEAPESESVQNVIYSVSTSAKAGDVIVLADDDNNVVCAMQTTKDMSGVIFSSANIETGKTYHIYVNPTYDGSFDQYGFAEGGTCSDGTDVGSVEVTSTLSQIGTGSVMSSGFGNMGNHGNKMGQ